MSICKWITVFLVCMKCADLISMSWAQVFIPMYVEIGVITVVHFLNEWVE